MVLIPRRAIVGLLLAGCAAGGAAWSQSAPRPGEVVLPLKDYLTLVETVERIEKERSRRVAERETPLAEVVRQSNAIVVRDGQADVRSEYEVLVQGAPQGPVFLPFSGWVREIEVSAGAAATAGDQGGLYLVASSPGRYTVRAVGKAAMERSGGVHRLPLAASLPAVASTELDLPADLGWSCPGAVVLDDQVVGERRKVSLAPRRGQSFTLEVRRRIDGGESEKLLAQSVVVTLVQLLPEGPRRHDVVLYEVSRGALESFAVELPPDLQVDVAGTDEGDVIPVVDARRLAAHRKSRLTGTGYLVLSSAMPEGIAGVSAAAVPLVSVRPEIDVRARYVAVSSAVAAELRPLPEASWSRVDLDDLPALLREAFAELDLTAAWRLAAPGVPAAQAETAAASLAMTVLPATPRLPAVVKKRETTTLMTVDGTLLHRERLTLDPSSGPGTALEVALPAGSTLWSAKVDEQPVRPLERGGRLAVPLGFGSGRTSVVEVVAVQERAIPPGRSELQLELAQIAVPVAEHSWRLLLPEGPKYRFRSGDLRPVGPVELPAIPPSRDPWARLESSLGRRTDRIDVGGNESGQQSGYLPPGEAVAVRARVVDQNGSALPGATVTVQGPPLPGSLVRVTDAKGVAVFTGLPPGDYEVEVYLEGFAPLRYPSRTIPKGRAANLEVTLSAAVHDSMTVTGESPLIDARRIASGATVREEDLDRSAKLQYKYEADNLSQGLVGGVKPLPVAIPESGKVLLLTGVLPPQRVAVTLDVKAKR